MQFSSNTQYHTQPLFESYFCAQKEWLVLYTISFLMADGFISNLKSMVAAEDCGL